MPHHFVNRSRSLDLSRAATERDAQIRWEKINAFVYALGGVVFIAGSLLFFPALEAYADIGAWTFFWGSLLYLIVTGHDLAEVVRHRLSGHTRPKDTVIELVAAFSYVVGTILFTVGSVLFLSWVGLTIPGAWCFVIGSLLFVVGACINVLQIVNARSLILLQLMNLTAITFVVGSVLFAVASVPYLWNFDSEGDTRTLDTFLAAQYLIGSILFLFGGIFNYWRSRIFVSDIE